MQKLNQSLTKMYLMSWWCKKTAGFSLLFEKEALADTDEGSPAIIPGDSKNSRLIQRLHETDPELRMPYKNLSLVKMRLICSLNGLIKVQNGERIGLIFLQKMKTPELNESTFSEKFFNNSIDKFIAVKMLEKNYPQIPYRIKVFWLEKFLST